MDSGPATHAAFGLTFRSSIDLPEMAPLPARATPGGAEPDIVIETGAAPSSLDGGVDVDAMMQVGSGDVLLRTPAGRFWARAGRRVIVDAAPGASARDVRLYLLGTVMAALCHQRAVLALHAAAIEVDGQIAAIAGPSGSGKSTLAAQFHAAGRPVWGDDLCAVDVRADGAAEGAARVWPGLSRIKLWPAALPLAGVGDLALPRVADDIDKVSLALPRLDPTRGAPLTRLYLLAPGGSDTVDIQRLSGPEAVAAVLDAIHRWPLAVALGGAEALFSRSVDLAGRCAVYRIGHEPDAARPRRLLERLEDHWRRDGAPARLERHA